VLRLTGERILKTGACKIIVGCPIDLEYAAMSPCSAWKYRLPIFLAVSIGMFNQLSGINAILYYLNDIFGHAGFQQGLGGSAGGGRRGANLLFTHAGHIGGLTRLGAQDPASSGFSRLRLPWLGRGFAMIFSNWVHARRISWCGSWIGYIAFLRVLARSS